MTQEEKDLLLKDLCARLPYGVKVECELDGGMMYATYNTTLDTDFLGEFIDDTANLKPYLRPMSSMTEEEIKDFGGYIDTQPITHQQGYKGYIVNCSHYYTVSEIDWLNEHHFDYRGLIEKGLAIEVTEENNPYK